MRNSKAYYISSILLLAFLFSSYYVLAEDLWEDSSDDEDDYYSDTYINAGVGGEVHIPVNPIPIPPFNIPSAPPPPSRRHSRKTAKLSNAKEAKESKGYISFPQASRKTMLGTRTQHYNTYPVTSDSSNFKFTEPENYEDASVLRHEDMVRPSEIDGRAFRHAFQAKSYRTQNDGKKHYGGVLKVQDVDEETNN